MKRSAEKPRSRVKSLLLLAAGLVAVVATALGGSYGPELYGLVRLGKEIDQMSAESTRTGGQWPRASEACIFCHGIEGNARAQNYPRLAGQPEAYIAKQLKAFASGERSDPTMTSLALTMSEREIEGLAAHFAKTAPLPNSTFHADSGRVARGDALAKANNCAACHGQKLEGKDVYPRLAGQGYGYLRDQLARFKSGERRDPSGAMSAIAKGLSAQDIDDVAQFLASR